MKKRQQCQVKPRETQLLCVRGKPGCSLRQLVPGKPEVRDLQLGGLGVGGKGVGGFITMLGGCS